MKPSRRHRTAVRQARPPRRRAKLFWTGGSQAVRLPREFRLPGDEVTVHREGERVVLEPVPVERDAKGWPLAFWQLAGSAPEFDVGPRHTPHERGDVLHRRR